MANTLANLARMYTETTGTSTLTLTNAVPGFNSFEDAGVTDGATITYAIYNGPHREIGAGVWTEATKTLTRATVYSSTASGAKITLAGKSEVFITPAKEDFDSLALASDLTAHLSDTSDAHDASAISFSATGNISSTDVQAAIAELDSEKLSTATAASTYQPLDGDLTALAALSGTNTLYYRSAADTWSAVTVNATLGFSAGTLGGSLASNYQPLDSELTAIAGLTSAADRLPYFTGSGTASLATFTTAGRNLIDDADASAQRTTLGLGTAAVANTGTSGNALPFLDATNNWSGGQIITLSNSNAVPMQFISTNADALAGPYLYLYRNSASPAANDVIGTISIRGNDSGGNITNYCEMDVLIDDTTDGNEDATFRITMPVAGSSAARFKFANGLQIGFPTGGFMGNGTVNAATLYEHGTSLAAKYGALASANTFTAAQTISVDSAATNTVTTVATIRSTSTGTPAAGIGVALDFAAETAAGNNEIGGRISAVTTDVTSTSEDFDLVFSAMAAGAAVTERGRITSKGTYKHQSFTVASLPAGTAGETCFASNGRKNGEGAGLGTGVLVFHDGTNWCACDTGAAVAA